MTKHIKPSLVLIVLLGSLLLSASALGEDMEPTSYQTRLAELRDTEVAIDAGTIPATGLGTTLKTLDEQRSWAQDCVRQNEEGLKAIAEELTLLGEPTTGEDLRVTLERTRVGNRVKVLENQIGGCRLLIVRAKKLADSILQLQSGQARRTLLTKADAIWEFEQSDKIQSNWSTWANSVSKDETTLESLILILLMSLGSLIVAFGSKTALSKALKIQKEQPHRQRWYYLQVLKTNLPTLVVGSVLWLGSLDLNRDIGQPLTSLGQLCLALGIALCIEELWRCRHSELHGSAQTFVSWKPVIVVAGFILFSLNPINSPALSPALDSIVRALLFGTLCIALTRIKQTWNPKESFFQSAVNFGFLIIVVCFISELLGFRNLAAAIFERVTFASLGLSLTLTSIRALSGALTRWSAQTHIETTEEATSSESVFLDSSGTWVEFTIGISLWTIFILYLVTLLGYGDQGFTALQRLTVDGFAIGEFQFVPGRIIFALLTLYALLTFTRWFRNIFETRWAKTTSMDRGARDAIITFLGYIGTSLSVIAALVVAGVDFTGLAILFSALSVGIGFGLQNVVNNFVSGLILLFERPIKSGDWVSVGSTEGHVKKIRIRSTLIQTLDRADVIVPNSELISAQVTNWMLRDRIGRVKVAIGVAYGSDTTLVKDLLIEVANAHPDILTSPTEHAPSVTFKDFGASSLDFSLRVFIPDIERRFVVASDLRFAIDAAFREHGIEIPFPQRDLHIRSGELPVKVKEVQHEDESAETS